MRSGGVRKRPHSGINLGQEVDINQHELRDVLDMYRLMPIFKVAEKAFSGKIMPEPFTFSIPKLGLKSTPEMQRIIQGHWVPWTRHIRRWLKTVGAVPFMLVSLDNDPEHQVPFTPDISTGYMTIETPDKKPPRPIYRWYSNNKVGAGGQRTPEKMYWIVKEDAPNAAGQLQSPLAALLPIYRSLCKLRNAQDVASTQAARPVHIIERTPHQKAGQDDNLTRLTADFDKAAGIGKARRERMYQQELKIKQQQLYSTLRETEMANRQRSTVQQTLWTDTPADLLEEMDSGFDNRVITLMEHMKYTTAARPQLVADYNKAEHQFNVMAAAVMDFALELLTPTGSGRSQNVVGATQFENERIRQETSDLESILQMVLVLAYRDRFNKIFNDVKQWRMQKYGGDASRMAELYPEAEVVVDLSGTTSTPDDEMRALWMDGIISKQTYAEHALRSKNIPLQFMQLSLWPDQYPKELLGRGAALSKKESAPEKKTPEERSAQEKSPKKKDTASKKKVAQEETAPKTKKGTGDAAAERASSEKETL